jgi:hypothetical protein
MAKIVTSEPAAAAVTPRSAAICGSTPETMKVSAPMAKAPRTRGRRWSMGGSGISSRIIELVSPPARVNEFNNS